MAVNIDNVGAIKAMFGPGPAGFLPQKKDFPPIPMAVPTIAGIPGVFRLTLRDKGRLESWFSGRMDSFERAHETAVRDVANALQTHLNMMMAAPWGWEGGARDIIDTGDLMTSGEVIVESAGVQVMYASPYANLVHYGGYIAPYGNQRLEKMYIPGRPWVAATLGTASGPLPPLDYKKIYMDSIKANAR